MRRTTGIGRVKALFLLVLVGYVLFTALFATSFSQGPNNRNVSVDTRVNVTQSRPVVLAVDIEGGTQNITLNAGSQRYVVCNASVRDYNGGSTVTANATFYDLAVATTLSPDDNNDHYTNGSCAVTATSGFFRNFSCSFPVEYYANVGFWECTVNVTDAYNFTDAGSNTTHIDGLLALNVTTLIDYGNLAVGDISSAQPANVTNLGNLNINVTVEGYGSTIDDGLSFVCEQENISIEYEKFNMIGGTDPLQYTNLSNNLQMVANLTIPQQTNDSKQELNTTFWLLEVPPNPFGLCNGTVIFQAEYSS